MVEIGQGLKVYRGHPQLITHLPRCMGIGALQQGEQYAQAINIVAGGVQAIVCE